MSSNALLQQEEKTYSTLSSVQKEVGAVAATKGDTHFWDNRTRFAVYGQAFLFLVAWGSTLGRLISGRYWDAKRNTEELEAIIADEDVPTSVTSFLKNVALSCYNERFMVYFPHVTGAIIWWNLYYLQLIPSIRRKHRKFHRILGRILMIAAIFQSVSGAGLAYMGHLPTEKIVSYLLAISVLYCVYNAWYYASRRDIPKHKYWAMRLVGYLNSIALQRVFMPVLTLAYRFGWLGLYPSYDENDQETSLQIFGDSFVCGVIVAMMLTEWYLAGFYGWPETTKHETPGDDTQPTINPPVMP